MPNQTDAALTLAELMLELTARGICCEFRNDRAGRGLAVTFSFEGRTISRLFDRKEAASYLGSIDSLVVRDLRDLGDRLLEARPAPLPIEQSVAAINNRRPSPPLPLEGLDVFVRFADDEPEIRLARVVNPLDIETESPLTRVGDRARVSCVSFEIDDQAIADRLRASLFSRAAWTLFGRLHYSADHALDILGGTAAARGRFNVVELILIDARVGRFKVSLRFKPEA